MVKKSASTWLLLGSFMLLAGCKAETKDVDAPTQIMLRIYNNDEVLLGEMKQLRTQLYMGKSWDKRAENVLEARALVWPVDIPVLPPNDQDFAEFEVIIEALDRDSRVVAQTRAVTSFVPEERRVLEVWLFVCPGHEANEGFVCANDSCHGQACAVCTIKGTCEAVGITAEDELTQLNTRKAPETKPNRDSDGGVTDGGLIDNEVLVGSCETDDPHACGSDEGECTAGLQLCSGGKWGPCQGMEAPRAEICDGKDNDCDGKRDEGVVPTWYEDGDFDGYGADDKTVARCEKPLREPTEPDWVREGGDCNDACADCHPKGTEVCSYDEGTKDSVTDRKLDEDCDDDVDEGVTTAMYEDRDGDDATLATPTTKQQCLVERSGKMVPPAGYLLTPSVQPDCCDTDENAFPGQTRFFVTARECGGFDYDCDGSPEQENESVVGDVCPPPGDWCDFNPLSAACTSEVNPCAVGEGRTGGSSYGWVSSVPACGASASAKHLVHCDDDSGGTRSVCVTSTLTMPCR